MPITACPDGEGSWFQETANNDPELAAACKAAYKSAFTPEFVRRVRENVERFSLELGVVDIGGVPSRENHEICGSATHLVILSPASMAPDKFRELQARYEACGISVPQDLEEVKTSWREFAEELGLTVVAEIFSDYDGTEDSVEGAGPDGVLRGSVHYLQRGENVSERPMIRALAEHLIRL